MLYLEDYMEMIENLPMEMRDRFTEMREMDLTVHNSMDSLDERLKNFFKKCGTTPNLKQDWKDETFAKIKLDYQKALEDADEKVQLATVIHDLLERYLRKLDQEVSKFKMELEADSMGITEILEKRSLELDRPPPSSNNHRTEKRKYSSLLSNHLEKRSRPFNPAEKEQSSSLAGMVTSHSEATSLPNLNPTISRSNSAAPSPNTSMFSSSTSTSKPALSYSLGHVGAGSNAAIAAAASRAIGATLEMSQGRRTSSLKASYEAVTKQSGFAKEFTNFTQQNFGSTSSDPMPPAPPPAKSSSSRHKKYRQQLKAKRQAQALAKQQAEQAAAAAAQAAAQAAVEAANQPPPTSLNPSGNANQVVASTAEVGVTGTDDTNSSTSWQYDPNEPRYCICNDVSYGDMVGCDNDDCPIEWFHYPCVGLAQAPKGKWFCPQCTAAMKRRGRK